MTQTPTLTRHDFDSREDLVDALTDHLQKRLEAQLTKQPLASAALSGGSSPEGVYAALAKRDLPWSRLEFTLTDERCVSQSDSLSNAGLLRRTLLCGPASGAHFAPLYRDRLALDEAQASAEATLSRLCWPLAFTLLGVGNDGHTASLFPCDGEITRHYDSEFRTAVVHPRSQPTARVTLTPKALLDSAELIFLGFGKDKRQTFERLVTEPDQTLPAARLMHQTTVPTSIYWAP